LPVPAHRVQQEIRFARRLRCHRPLMSWLSPPKPAVAARIGMSCNPTPAAFHQVHWPLLVKFWGCWDYYPHHASQADPEDYCPWIHHTGYWGGQRCKLEVRGDKNWLARTSG